jgi:hypothetical protein
MPLCSMSAFVIEGAALKSMSAMPMPTWMLSLPYCRMIESYLIELVPKRLYGVSKSNLPPAPGATAPAVAAATAGTPPPTAPKSAVMPAF